MMPHQYAPAQFDPFFWQRQWGLGVIVGVEYAASALATWGSWVQSLLPPPKWYKSIESVKENWNGTRSVISVDFKRA